MCCIFFKENDLQQIIRHLMDHIYSHDIQSIIVNNLQQVVNLQIPSDFKTELHKTLCVEHQWVMQLAGGGFSGLLHVTN